MLPFTKAVKNHSSPSLILIFLNCSEKFQSQLHEQDLDAAAASLDRAIDTSSSSDTEQLELGHGPSWGSTFQASQQPVAPKAASLNKPGQYSSAAERMMAMMGYKSGTGLGKKAQGRVEPVGISKQRGRRGLGLVLKGKLYPKRI